MQPLAYLAIRALLSWIQFVQRSERAFVNNPLVLVAAGAVHCWAVVYSLFVAVHTRAMRYDGYHEGYVEHLPGAVAWTETLAVASLWVWLLAGFTTAAVRILDEDSGNLPMGDRDTKGGLFTDIIRSPLFHSTLGHAHSISCVGLFISILVLCFTMGFMKGGITMCEICLVLVAVGFALPHAVLATTRLGEGVEFLLMQLLPAQATEAAASEAAALGPQLCIVLALADAPGHAYIWQNAIYFLGSVSLLAAVFASARAPPKDAGVALPPEPHETWVCLVVDAAAAVAIVLSYPHLNTWFLWICFLAVPGLAACVRLQEVRAVYEDWLEPVLVLRGDTHKRLPGPQRQLLRRNSWILSLICVTTALWDIMWHPVPVYAADGAGPPQVNLPGGLMLRWQPTVEVTDVSERILPALAATLGENTSSLQVEKTFPEHRLMIFKYTGQSRLMQATVALTWTSFMGHPQGELAGIVDGHFPPVLNMTVCGMAKQANEATKGRDQGSEGTPSSKDEISSKDETLSGKDEASSGKESGQAVGAGVEAEARTAYLAACDWWRAQLLWGLAQNPNESQSATG